MFELFICIHISLFGGGGEMSPHGLDTSEWLKIQQIFLRRFMATYLVLARTKPVTLLEVGMVCAVWCL